MVDEKDKCKSCKGKKIAEVKKTLEVAVEPGCPAEQDIYLHGESDEAVLIIFVMIIAWYLSRRFSV